MKRHLTILSLAAFLMISLDLSAQKDKSKRPSPPAQVTASVDGLSITIDYSQPSVKGREIFGGLVPYGQVWRTGANETTWIQVSEDAKINGETLEKGKYGFFTIPGEDEWILIFNTKIKWGAYDYSADDDVLRVKVKPQKSDSFTEQFTITLSEQGEVGIMWADLMVPFTVSR